MSNIYTQLLLLTDESPDRPAILVEGQPAISRWQLLEIVRRIAESLADAGVSSGSRVLIYMGKQTEALAAVVACAALGAIGVPVSPKSRQPQLLHLLKDAAPDAVLVAGHRGHATRAAIGELNTCDQPPVLEVEHILTTHTGRCETRLVEKQTSADDPAVLIYTSGSTGLPKGVVVSHGNLHMGATSMVELLHLSPSDTIAALLPFSFDAGLSQFTSSLYSGATLRIVEDIHPAMATKQLQLGVTVAIAVPAMWRAMAMTRDQPLPGLRIIGSTGGSMPEPLLNQLVNLFPGATPFIMYGFTEAFRACHIPPASHPVPSNTLGIPNPGVSVRVEQPDGTECAIDEHGELVQYGPLVTKGYWNDPTRTAQMFTSSRPPHGARSGDRVSLNKNGMLYWHGRLVDQAKIAGNRVCAHELEAVCADLDLFQAYAATLLPNANGDDSHVLALAAVPIDKSTTEKDVTRSIARVVPGHLIPKLIVFIEHLPLTDNGKINYAGIRELFASIPGADVARAQQ